MAIFRRLQPVYHFVMNALAALVYWYPSEQMIVIGVTGTTGKTTVVYMIAQMLKDAGITVGYTSTAMFGDGHKEWINDKKMTMLGRFFTQKILRTMVHNKCQVAIVETTSEGIRQYRHRFINYDICIFTGIYPEHIESHGGFENYKNAKKQLFAHLVQCQPKKFHFVNSVLRKIHTLPKTSIINGDDAYAQEFLNYDIAQKISFTNQNHFFDHVQSILYQAVHSGVSGIDVQYDNTTVHLNMLGIFNATNGVVAASVGKVLGLSSEQIAHGLGQIIGVPGRLERIDEGQDFMVIVDYAFEPVALGKLYDVVEQLSPHRIIHVLGGTGGGRDVARREKMGKFVGCNADYVVVTNEDPYNEDPQQIIDMVFAGVIQNDSKKEQKNCWRIMDRVQAINHALHLAQKGDVVLITGKGSEQTICIEDGKTIPHDDRMVVHKILQK